MTSEFSPEFSRMIDTRSLGNDPVRLDAGEAERAALARRVGIVAVHSLSAAVELEPVKRAILATGRLDAEIVQSCAISGEDLPVTISEPLSFRFVPERGPGRPDEEIELGAEDLDEIEFTGTQFDLGEAIAQTLALAIDPFREGPGAEEFRRKSGYFGGGPESPFAALAKLKKD